MSRHSITVGLLFVLFSTTGALAQFPVDESGKPTFAPILREVLPAVVNISVVSTTRVTPNPFFNDPFFERFFDLPEQPDVIPQQSAGSGVIVDAGEGYVVTNHHVIENANEIVVTLADRRRFDAKLIGSDAGTDIALLQIEAGDLSAVPFGDSDDLEVGDFVVAIGNPFGLGQTVTSGIVSALGRSGLNIEGYEDFIQTDASINPGNSGGALVDLDGALVGINTAIIAPAGGNVGIGFSVPSNMAQGVIEQLLEYGEVRRGRLGVTIQDLTPELAEALDLDVDKGAVVVQVEPESPAERAGIRAGDVIIGLDDQPVEGSADLRNQIGLIPIGEDIELTLLQDGRRRQVRARIGAPSAATETVAGGEIVEKLQGAEFRDLEESHPRYGEVEGVLIAQVDQDSPAWRSGLRQGDVVLAVNRNSVGSVDELSRALGEAGRAVALDILRGNSRLFIVIQ